MKSGSIIASCDGNINIWDIEKTDTLAFLNAPDKPFSHMHVVSSKSGIISVTFNLLFTKNYHHIF